MIRILRIMLGWRANADGRSSYWIVLRSGRKTQNAKSQCAGKIQDCLAGWVGNVLIVSTEIPIATESSSLSLGLSRMRDCQFTSKFRSHHPRLPHYGQSIMIFLGFVVNKLYFCHDERLTQNENSKFKNH
jgi:hypothetical protein